MSTSYTVRIKRNCDGKILGEVLSDTLKNIINSEFCECIHCNGFNSSGVTFTYDDLCNVSELAFKKLQSLYDEIREKKLMILLAKSVDIKHEIEEDTSYIEECIGELRWTIESASFMQGQISAVVENLVKGKRAAYQYNGKDLPKETHEYANGKTYECDAYVWCKDVTCEIIVS